MAAKRGKVFSIKNEDAYYTEDNGQIIAHSQTRSFKAVRQGKKKVIIYEVYRKGRKPTRRATFKAKKDQKVIYTTDAVKRYRDSKYARRQYQSLGGSERFSKKYSSNTKPRFNNRNQIQLQIVADVRDSKSGVSDVYMGYSRKYKTYRKSYERERTAYQEAIDMCIAKFYAEHGLSRTGDAIVEVISKRYIVRYER